MGESALPIASMPSGVSIFGPKAGLRVASGPTPLRPSFSLIQLMKSVGG